MVDDVRIVSPVTGFGELNVAQNRAFIQAQAVYDVLPANFRTFTGTSTGTSGTATATGRQFQVTTGTDSGGYGRLRSFRSLNYKPGEAGLGEWTAVFDTPVADSTQIAGLFTEFDGFGAGYENTSYGLLHRHGGLAECRELQITTGATGSETASVTVNGTLYSIPITSGTVQLNAHEIAVYLEANQSDWGAEQLDDNVQLLALTDSARSGTYSFSSTGDAEGTFSQLRAGVTKTDTWIPIDEWEPGGFNVSVINPQLGNLYKVNYQYLGYGGIEFSIENPDTSRYEVVHVIKYANTATVPSIGNPSLPIGVEVLSTGSTTDLTIKCGSFNASVQGTEERTRNPRAFINTKASISSSADFTNIFTIRNRQAVNSYTNEIELELLELAISTDSTKPIEFKLVANPTVAGTPNFQTLSGTGLVPSFDTSGTTVTGGRFLYAGEAGVFDISNLRIRIPPTLEVSIVARITGGSASDVTASMVWYEDV